jgi:hypothetical protein
MGRESPSIGQGSSSLRNPSALPRRGGIVAPSSCNILYLSLYGPAEAEGDAVGEGDGEAVGDAVGVLVVVGPVEGAGVVVAGAVFSGRAGGSYGPLSAADNAAAITTEASKHAGASTITSGRRTNGRTHPSKTYHNNAANTTTTAADSHHGYPRINALLCPPIRYPHRTRPRGAILERAATGSVPYATPPRLSWAIFAPLGRDLYKVLDADFRELDPSRPLGE